MGPTFLTAYRSLVLLLALMLVGALASVPSIAQAVNAKSGEEDTTKSAESEAGTKPTAVPPDSAGLERVNTPEAIYPLKAQKKGIQGQVMVKFVISEEGDVESAEATSGDPLLAAAAVDAAKQWKFKPYIKNDKPVRVTTSIPFDFAFSDKVREISVSEPRDPKWAIPLPPGVVQGRLIHQVVPIYPKEAKQRHIQGTVVLQIVIGKDGRLRDLTPISGPIELYSAAIGAVQQWRYTPFEKDGAPVAVQTTITVDFTLSR